MSNKIPKEILGLAGEYAVASEICRLGFYAQITYGRWKNIDVLAVNPDTGKTVLIEVKAKQGREWPAIRGVKGPSRLLILVDYYGKSFGERPDFYVLDASDWKEYLEAIKDEVAEIRDNYIPVWPDGYVGMGLKAEQVLKHKEKWNKLLDKLK